MVDHIRSMNDAGIRPCIVAPDNSYSTFEDNAEMFTSFRLSADVHEVPTQQANRLHLTGEDVNEHYDRYPTHSNGVTYGNLWYITTVGNPSGTFTSPSKLCGTLDAIVRRDPNAKVILDNVYARTLKEERARALFKPVLDEKDFMDRVGFVESMSKVHGLCSARVGMFFSANPAVTGTAQNAHMTMSAGEGLFKGAVALAVADGDEEERGKLRELHEFWRRERAGLYMHLITSGNFPGLFHRDQRHIDPGELEEPAGLYLLPRLQEKVPFERVIVETEGCFGVPTKMASGDYMRFAVGKITKPTFAKYLDEAPSVEKAPS